MNHWGTILKSKTFWGTVIGTVATVLAQPKIDITVIAQAAGAIIAAAGIRGAIAKGPADSQ